MKDFIYKLEKYTEHERDHNYTPQELIVIIAEAIAYHFEFEVK